MRKIISLVLVFITCESVAQKDESLLKFLSAFQNETYIMGGEQQQIFYNNNKNLIDRLNDEIADLPIDRCKFNTIDLLIFIDTLGNSPEILLKNGTDVDKINNSIIEKVNMLDGKWKPVVEDGVSINFIAEIRFILLNSYHITRTTRKENELNNTIHNNDGYTITITQTKDFDHDKNCQDSEFYYNKGLEEFNNLKYKKASDYFSKAIVINPFFVDALYNSGVSYLKQNKLAEGCRSLDKAYAYGDKDAGEIIKKVCQDINR